ncbi:similar to An15g03300 [Aspergillus luchuensis]|uniref:Similar to An15g03300 n=1 Tax=Aspergillus kawachii TaxID=1069201 RepID=A0A146FUN7_ASPKA|nr:similar to An15g03300 [Aspergillus luchuensis IFO 4308]GAT29484.1 similar to An15g03300 [Aspergillus luchuensis]
MSDTNENTPLPGTSQTLPIALNAISDATEPHTIDPSSLTPYEKKLYDFLYSQGWTHTQCSCFIAQIEQMKEAISHRYYSQGCNTAQVQCLHEQCEMELPEHFPAPRGNAEQQDLQMQLRLNEEMNRRRAIGERMYSSTGTMDREIDEGRRA